MINKLIVLCALASILFLVGCNCTKQTTTTFQPISINNSAPLIIYKADKKFANYIPVLLNDEGTKIVSYPAPSDIFIDGKLAKPTALKNNYWIDNRGISAHSAFINYTYEEYSKLADAPTLEIMYSKIIAKNAITQVYNCGSKNRVINQQLIDELNDEIKNNQLKKCKCLTDK
jgi:uncharacterized lipoprotein YajG